MQGIVEDIFVADQGGAAMQRVVEVEAVAGQGLQGDRYMHGTGFYSRTDECEVTLIEIEALELIQAETDVRVVDGEHRRNIVTRNLRLHELVGRRFTIGETVLKYDRPRPPCGYIQTITQHGMTKALADGRGGICARVIKTGMIRVHDRIELL